MFFSPLGVSIQFVIGVVAYRLSLVSLPARLLLIGSNLGAIGLMALYLLIIEGAFNFGGIGNTLFTTLVALATALIMLGSRTDSAVSRLLSGTGILYIGTISYSLYLFHVFAAAMVTRIRFTAFDGMAAAYHAFTFLVALGLAIIIATGVYRLVEVPGRRYVRAVADRLLGIGSVATAPADVRTPAE